MLKARYCRYYLRFKRPAITSRETMRRKLTYIVQVWDEMNPEITGTGEVALFEGLSREDSNHFETGLRNSLKNIDTFDCSKSNESSVIFGIETALAGLRNGGSDIIFPSSFTEGEKSITINGLIWMGEFHEMRERIKEKLNEGFKCIKLKIGGINFYDELELLRWLRAQFSSADLSIRLDANCSLSRCRYSVAIDLLDKLSRYDVHSIEQPFAPQDFVLTRRVCRENILPIALDEQLIGVTDDNAKEELLDFINPQYVILKPSLCGGFHHARRWLEAAEKREIGWWVTSALESAIGLNAIAQWVGTLATDMPQGLGTGELYTNDFDSQIVRRGEILHFDTSDSSSLNKMERLDWLYV